MRCNKRAKQEGNSIHHVKWQKKKKNVCRKCKQHVYVLKARLYMVENNFFIHTDFLR